MANCTLNYIYEVEWYAIGQVAAASCHSRGALNYCMKQRGNSIDLILRRALWIVLVEQLRQLWDHSH
jgi:hypothetical protein